MTTRRVVGKVNVLGVSITVIETDEEHELTVNEQPVLGYYAASLYTIVLDSRQPPDRKLETFKHEIGHVVFDRLGLDLALLERCAPQFAGMFEELVCDKFLPAALDAWQAASWLSFRKKEKKRAKRTR